MYPELSGAATLLTVADFLEAVTTAPVAAAAPAPAAAALRRLRTLKRFTEADGSWSAETLVLGEADL